MVPIEYFPTSYDISDIPSTIRHGLRLLREESRFLSPEGQGAVTPLLAAGGTLADYQ